VNDIVSMIAHERILLARQHTVLSCGVGTGTGTDVAGEEEGARGSTASVSEKDSDARSSFSLFLWALIVLVGMALGVLIALTHGFAHDSHTSGTGPAIVVSARRGLDLLSPSKRRLGSCNRDLAELPS
jgi:hypothetical protein